MYQKILRVYLENTRSHHESCHNFPGKIYKIIYNFLLIIYIIHTILKTLSTAIITEKQYNFN